VNYISVDEKTWPPCLKIEHRGQTAVNEYILVFDFDPMETFVELLMLKKEDHLYVSLSVIFFEIYNF
jgi:hypothetical protein